MEKYSDICTCAAACVCVHSQILIKNKVQTPAYRSYSPSQEKMKEAQVGGICLWSHIEVEATLGPEPRLLGPLSERIASCFMEE